MNFKRRLTVQRHVAGAILKHAAIRRSRLVSVSLDYRSLVCVEGRFNLIYFSGIILCVLKLLEAERWRLLASTPPEYLCVCVCVCCGWEGLGVRVRNRCLYLLSLLEPSSGDRVALLVLQQLLRRLEELVAHVTLEHSGDEVDLQVPLVHAARLAHKIAEDTLESWGGGIGRV